MNKKHREAFRELRDWCKKHNAMIYANHHHDFCIGFREGLSAIFICPDIFDEKTELVLDCDNQHHSISSEGEDE